MGLLDGKVTVITGAGSGMAKASTRLFVEEGAQVLAADISGAEQETADQVGDAVVACHVDVTQEAEVEAMFARALEVFGRVDVVCNVAGTGQAVPMVEVTMDHFDQIVDVDLRGVLLGMKHGIRSMLPTGGGSIINWSSVGGLNGSVRGSSVYSAAKAGVISLTKAAAVEYGAQGIRVNALCPGFILTELMGEAGLEHFPGLADKAALGRAGQPVEVAQVAAFLASDRAAYVSGAIIPVDGAWSAKLA